MSFVPISSMQHVCGGVQCLAPYGSHRLRNRSVEAASFVARSRRQLADVAPIRELGSSVSHVRRHPVVVDVVAPTRPCRHRRARRRRARHDASGWWRDAGRALDDAPNVFELPAAAVCTCSCNAASVGGFGGVRRRGVLALLGFTRRCLWARRSQRPQRFAPRRACTARSAPSAPYGRLLQMVVAARELNLHFALRARGKLADEAARSAVALDVFELDLAVPDRARASLGRALRGRRPRSALDAFAAYGQPRRNRSSSSRAAATAATPARRRRRGREFGVDRRPPRLDVGSSWVLVGCRHHRVDAMGNKLADPGGDARREPRGRARRRRQLRRRGRSTWSARARARGCARSTRPAASSRRSQARAVATAACGGGTRTARSSPRPRCSRSAT